LKFDTRAKICFNSLLQVLVVVISVQRVQGIVITIKISNSNNRPHILTTYATHVYRPATKTILVWKLMT